MLCILSLGQSCLLRVNSMHKIVSIVVIKCWFTIDTSQVNVCRCVIDIYTIIYLICAFMSRWDPNVYLHCIVRSRCTCCCWVTLTGVPRAAGVFVCLLEYPRGKRNKGTSVERTWVPTYTIPSWRFCKVTLTVMQQIWFHQLKASHKQVFIAESLKVHYK